LGGRLIAATAEAGAARGAALSELFRIAHERPCHAAHGFQRFAEELFLAAMDGNGRNGYR
jgi:hypothetical protein